MQLRTLALVGAIGVIGFVAGRTARSAPESRYTPVPAPWCDERPRSLPVAAAPVREVAAVPEPEATDDDPADDGQDVADVLAAANQRVAADLRTHNAITGTVTDMHNGDALAGVTVIVDAPSMPTQTAITGEHGEYALYNLPPANYHMTFYYNDSTTELDGVTSSSCCVTDRRLAIDPYPQRIPVPGRTFEAVLGVAAGSQEDGLGVSFSGGTSLDNEYVIDDN